MAKKTKQAAAINEPEILELDKTIKVDGQTYNVNAVKATQVDNKLKMNLSNGEAVEFDGSTEKAVDIMTPAGGAFTGPVTVENHTAAISDKDVLNYSEITNTVLAQLINNSILYNWDGNALVPAIDEAQLNSISIVQGNGNIEDFAKDNCDNKYLSAYLFLNTVNNETQIFFGTSDSNTPIPLVTGSSAMAAEAGKLSTPRTITVKLGSTNSARFDGSADVEAGVSGILPVTKGGTGTDALTKIIVGKANALIDASDNSKVATATDVMANRVDINNITTNVNKIINGETKVASAGNADKATSDAYGSNIRTSYYRSASNSINANTITISTSAPSGGNDGDIWIVYKA